MITTLVVGSVLTLLLILFNIPGKSWRRLKYGDKAYEILLEQKTGRSVEGTVLLHSWNPIQRYVIYRTLWDNVDLDTATLPTGGANPSRITIHTWGFEMRIVDVEKAYDNTPDHDPESSLKRRAYQAVMEYTSKTDVAVMHSQGLEEFAKHVTKELQEAAETYGAEARNFFAKDIDWPQGLEDATDENFRTEAMVERSRRLSEQEKENYEREYGVQKENYIKKQALDSFVEATRNGLKVLGGNVLATFGIGNDNEGGEK